MMRQNGCILKRPNKTFVFLRKKKNKLRHFKIQMHQISVLWEYHATVGEGACVRSSSVKSSCIRDSCVGGCPVHSFCPWWPCARLRLLCCSPVAPVSSANWLPRLRNVALAHRADRSLFHRLGSFCFGTFGEGGGG